jgi:hypothetical protein
MPASTTSRISSDNATTRTSTAALTLCTTLTTIDQTLN